MKAITILIAGALGSAWLHAGPALGQDLPALESIPVLRAEVSVSAPLVTIGDLVDGAGSIAADLAAKPVFRAPDLGRAGTVEAETVLAALRAAGVEEVDAGDTATVRVSRASRPVPAEEMTALVRAGLAEALGADADRLDVTFDHLPTAEEADPAAARPVALATLNRTPGNRFEAVVAVDRGHGDILRIRLAGAAVEMADILTATRPVERGESIGSNDVAVIRVPARGAGASNSPAPADVIGLVARHPLRPGTPLTDADFGPPLLVKRGDTVTLVYRTASLTLSISGRALADGVQGSTVPVVNLRSDRIIQTSVTGPGVVEVTANQRRVSIGQGAIR